MMGVAVGTPVTGASTRSDPSGTGLLVVYQPLRSSHLPNPALGSLTAIEEAVPSETIPFTVGQPPSLLQA